MDQYFTTNPESGSQSDAYYMHHAAAGYGDLPHTHSTSWSINPQAAHEANPTGYGLPHQDLQYDALPQGNIRADLYPFESRYAEHGSNEDGLPYSLTTVYSSSQGPEHGFGSAGYLALSNDWTTSPADTDDRALHGNKGLVHNSIIPPASGFSTPASNSATPTPSSKPNDHTSTLHPHFTSIPPPVPLPPPHPANPKPRFPCLHPHCTKTFSRSSDLARHFGKHMAGAPRVYCGVEGCKFSGERGFYRRDKLLSHVRNVHGGWVDGEDE